MNGTGISRKMFAWTLLPPLGYLIFTIVMFRENSQRSGRMWDSVSAPGASVMKMMGWTGGFEAGIVSDAFINLLIYGLIGFALGYVVERLSGRKPWTRRARCKKCDSPLKTASTSGFCAHCESA